MTDKVPLITPSSPMMRELQRWARPTRLKVDAPRWAEWARSMIGRQRAVSAAGRAQAMTFVKPARLVQLHERLINLSSHFYSTMNLAIQPILREMRLADETASRGRQAQPNGSRAYLAVDADTTLLRSTGLANETGAILPLTFAGRGGVAEPLVNTSAIQPGTTRATASTAGAYSSARIASSPPGLSMVFRRLRQLDEFAGSDDPSEMIREDAGRHARRLTSQLQRVEQAMSGSAPEVARRVPSSATTQQAAPQVAAIEHTAQQTLGMFKAHEQSWRANAPEMPDAIVEQLTERVIRQIDQRTIAWRERMGKI